MMFLSTAENNFALIVKLRGNSLEAPFNGFGRKVHNILLLYLEKCNCENCNLQVLLVLSFVSLNSFIQIFCTNVSSKLLICVVFWSW